MELPDLPGFVAVGNCYLPTHYAIAYRRLLEADPQAAASYLRRFGVNPRNVLLDPQAKPKRKHVATKLTTRQKLERYKWQWLGRREIAEIMDCEVRELVGLPQPTDKPGVGDCWTKQQIMDWMNRPRLSPDSDDLALD